MKMKKKRREEEERRRERAEVRGSGGRVTTALPRHREGAHRAWRRVAAGGKRAWGP